MSPIETLACSSKRCVKVTPPLVVFTMPPAAAPTKYVERSPGMPTTTAMRPA
jgi:hypothetical protein